jgi:hypothetical protein
MDNSPSSTEPTGSELPTTSAETVDAPAAYAPVAAASAADSMPLPQDQVALVLPVADHAESVSLVARIETKLATVAHDALDGVKADVAKLKALLHL